MPFAGQDAWRKHPLISGLWKDPFPGLRPAAIAFAAFCVFDWVREEKERIRRK